MPKEIFTVRDFSGGLSSVRDPRDISDKEFVYLKNFYVDQLGALRPSGSLVAHDGLINNKNISSMSSCVIEDSGGRNLFYFESDYDAGGAAAITSDTNNPIVFVQETGGNMSSPTAPPDVGINL
jgi:hypothetical protein